MERRKFMVLLGGLGAFARTLSKYPAASPLLADPAAQEKESPGPAAPIAIHPENPISSMHSQFRAGSRPSLSISQMPPWQNPAPTISPIWRMAGQPISGPIVFGLPEGTYRVCFYSPSAGVYSPGIRVQGRDRVTLEIPSFKQDIVLRVKREH